MGGLRARAARHRHGPAEHRAALGEPRPLHDHDREGLPARPGRAARPLPRGVAARARGVADRGLARVPALRLPQALGGGHVRRGRVLVALLGLVALPAHAEEWPDADLRRLFPEQAAVFVAPPAALARLKVPAEAPDGGTRRIVENGSLFHLPNIAKEKTRVTLLPLAGARLTVTLEGEDGFYLEPRLVFESARFLDPREEASVPLQELARRRGEG